MGNHPMDWLGFGFELLPFVEGQWETTPFQHQTTGLQTTTWSGADIWGATIQSGLSQGAIVIQQQKRARWFFSGSSLEANAPGPPAVSMVVPPPLPHEVSSPDSDSEIDLTEEVGATKPKRQGGAGGLRRGGKLKPSPMVALPCLRLLF